MTHQHSIVVFFVAILLMAPSVSTLNYKNFEMEAGRNRDKLVSYLSSVLCTIDLKYANIYFELESAGKLLDGIVAESSRCVPPTLTIITEMIADVGRKQHHLLSFPCFSKNAFEGLLARYKTELLNFRYDREGVNVATNTSDGARLIMLIAKEFDFEKSMFPKLIHIRKKSNFELFYMIVSEVIISSHHESLLKQMYKNYNLLNAVVVAVESGSSEPTVSTYNPFNNTTMRIPNNVYKRSELFIKKNSNIFGSPLHIVMHKDLLTSVTSLHVSKTINFDYDVFLPDLISSAMNATLILRDPFTEESRIEDSETADLIINGRSYEIGAILGAGVEETNIVRRDDICILLPYIRIRNTFEIIYRMVDPLVWMLMVAVIFQAWISLFIIRWVQSLIQQYNTWRHVFLFDLFGFHMNQGLTNMPKKVSPRLIIASCLMYSLVVKTIFEGLMYTSMAKNKDSRISTISELLESRDHEILVSNTFYNVSEYFINNSPIKGHFRVVEYSQYMKQYTRRRDGSNRNRTKYAYILRRRVAKYLENTQTFRGAPVYYTMDECIVPFVVCYFVRQGSPFLDQINQILRISEESGILNYWEKQVTNVYTKLKHSQRLFAHRSAIKFKQLVFVFQALGYGLAIAATVFVFELYASRLEISADNWPLMKWYRAHQIQV